MDIYVIKVRFDITTLPACDTLHYCLSYQGFPDSSDGKEFASNAGNQGSIPGMGRSPGEGNGNPTHCSILAWRIPWTEEPCRLQSVGSLRVRHNWVTNTRTLPTRASLVAQTVKNPSVMQETRFNPWVGKIPWRRTWLPTPVFLPGKSHEQRSLADYSPWERVRQT